MVLSWIEFALKTIMKPHRRDITQEKLEECLPAIWSPLPYIPVHAGIESVEAQIQAE